MTCSWSTGAASSLPSAGLVPLLHLSLTAGPTPRAQEQRGGERVPSGTPGIKLSERRTAHHPDGVTCSSTGCQRRPKGREQGSWAPHRTGTAPAWGGGGLRRGPRIQKAELRAEEPPGQIQVIRGAAGGEGSRAGWSGSKRTQAAITGDISIPSRLSSF